MARASIVFAHGLWADGSCFSKLVPALQAEGHQVMASQHGLDSIVRSGMGDQGAAVRVADKYHGAADPPEATYDAVHVAF